MPPKRSPLVVLYGRTTIIDCQYDWSMKTLLDDVTLRKAAIPPKRRTWIVILEKQVTAQATTAHTKEGAFATKRRALLVANGVSTGGCRKPSRWQREVVTGDGE